MDPEEQKVLAPRRHSAVISPTRGSFHVAGLTVNVDHASVSRGGEVIELRPKTYRVLLCLLERPNRLVTKEELLSTVWEGTAVADDVLVRCIGDLRKAFRDDPKEPRVLKTFPKLGYGLMADVEPLTAETPPAPADPEISPTRRALPRKAIAGLILLAAMSAGIWWTWRQSAEQPIPEERAEAGWWRMDEGRGGRVRDSSLGRLDGAMTGALNWKKEGRAGLEFHGGDGVVTGRGVTGLPAGDQARTVTLWARPATPWVDAGGLFAYGSMARDASSRRFEIDFDLKGVLSFGAPAPGASLSGRRVVTPGEWHMVTGIYEGPPSHRAALMIDGVPDAESKLTPPDTDSRGTWQIGRAPLGGTFRGEMRDLRVYGEALTEAQIRALYRCSAEKRDMGDLFYVPVYGNDVVIEDRSAADASAAISNGGKDFAGVQFARSDGVCGLPALRGIDAGQDLRIALDILVPRDAAGHVSEGGPYFRSRRAMAGDGLIGGTSAGYWVELKSTGMVKVRRLNPQDVVAFSLPRPDFDASVYHRLEVEARGEELRVRLDGTAVEFRQEAATRPAVRIPPLWDGPPAIGRNRGAAGIAFGAEENRGQLGGQRVRNVQITPLGLPR
jgi:DNA-binding winged helix-turn-helix (wHTH) protein